MARTLNPEAHALKRDSYIEVAQKLIATKGYEQFSVQDVLDELGASKGAFYHYFDSKQALLRAVVEVMVDAVTVVLGPVAGDRELSAVEKINRLFGTLASWKGERTDLMLGMLQIWLSADNTVVRDGLRQGIARTLTPLFETIVRQGIAEGSMNPSSAEGAAATLVSLIQGANDRATHLFVERAHNEVTYEHVRCVVYAYAEAYERVLGLAAGSLTFIDEATLRFWYGGGFVAKESK